MHNTNNNNNPSDRPTLKTTVNTCNTQMYSSNNEHISSKENTREVTKSSKLRYLSYRDNDIKKGY